jgi:small GTP-binding protein
MWRTKSIARRVPILGKRFLSSFGQIFQPHHTLIIDEEIALLQKLQTVVSNVDQHSPELSLLKDTLCGINDLFMIVVVGEFNSGKSSLINSLLGGNFLSTGVLPTTSKVHVLRSRDNATKVWKTTENLLLKDFEEVDLPIDWLKHIAIIDTPGTNAIYANHEKITQQVIPRSDLVLFVTSVERPITESEAGFLRKICDWGKQVVVVVNKIDTVSPADREAILAFVSHNSSSIIGTSNPVPIFGVSSRLGIKAKLTPKIGNESIDDGNIGALEKYLLNTLGHQQIIKMKLENPLKIADRVITNCETTLKERLDMLDGDRHVLGYIEENMVAFQDDINKEVAFFRRQIHAILDNVQLRGEAFLDENISIFKPKLLFDRKAFELAFERDVAFEIGQPIDDVISDISELILKRAKSHAHAVDAYLGSRPKRYSKEIIGQVRGLDDPGNLFTASRQTLLERLRRDISEIIESHDSSKESRHISLGVRGSLNQMLALQSVSSVAAGGLFFAQFIDISGLIAATGFASSLVLLPYRKQTIK